MIWLRDDLRTVAEMDVPGIGPWRNPGNVMRLLTFLGRGVATPLTMTSVAHVVGGHNRPVAYDLFSEIVVFMHNHSVGSCDPGEIP